MTTNNEPVVVLVNRHYFDLALIQSKNLENTISVLAMDIIKMAEEVESVVVKNALVNVFKTLHTCEVREVRDCLHKAAKEYSDWRINLNDDHE